MITKLLLTCALGLAFLPLMSASTQAAEIVVSERHAHPEHIAYHHRHVTYHHYRHHYYDDNPYNYRNRYYYRTTGHRHHFGPNSVSVEIH